jgi:hypothetical protein
VVRVAERGYRPPVAARTGTHEEVGARFLDALTRRDYEALGGCFAADARLRAVVPPGWREDDGPRAIVSRFRLWTEDVDDYEVLETEAVPFADVLRLRWAVRGIDTSVPGGGPSTFEQVAYAEISDGRISHLRLACSGQRPDP